MNNPLNEKNIELTSCKYNRENIRRLDPSEKEWRAGWEAMDEMYGLRNCPIRRLDSPGPGVDRRNAKWQTAHCWADRYGRRSWISASH